MAYNKENYRRIRTAYQTKYLRAYAEADRRTAEVHEKSPEIAAIDRELAQTGAEIAMATLGTGEEYRAKLAAVEEKNLALQARRRVLLEALGYPADYTLPPYECPLCMDSGFVGTKMCDCMRRELVLAAYESSGLGQLMKSQSFDSFNLKYYAHDAALLAQMKQNLELLRAYAEAFEPHADSLILCGDTGLGKTHLSTSVARRVIERGFDVYYTGAIQMFADFEAVRFGSAEGAADPARYTDCDLLILDDLGTEVTNQFTNSCLYLVLNNRINLGKPTIINTNLTGKEIRNRYTDRIASRILGDFKPLLFSGIDIRRQKLAEK